MKLVFSFLVALALLFAPFGMRSGEAMATPSGGGAEMAHMEGHCSKPAEPSGSDEGSKAMLDCMSICSAIAPPSSPMAGPALLAPLVLVAERAGMLVGSSPQKDPPPPRFS